MSAPEHQSSDPPLKQIYFYLTGGCNLRCRHCWVITDQAKTEAFLDPGLLESIVKQGQPLGLTSVKLTGGEPFLHPHIRRILNFIKDTDLHLVVESNGVLLNPDLAKAVASCRSPRISVSLDGSEAETHEWVRGVPGCFQAALKGITYLVEAGLKPQIIFSMMRRNRDQIEAVVRLAEKLGAGSVKFNVIQASPRADVMQENQETLTIEELLELGYWVERELIKNVDIPILFHHPPAFRPLSLLCGGKAQGLTCGILNIIGVLADGSYALCGIGGYVPEMVFGHAAKDRLADVWINHPVLRDIRDGLPQRLTGICGECLVRSRCLGFCLAQNYYNAQDLWAPYWFCDQAEAAGLFPTTRKRPTPVEKKAKSL
ncbi:MAG: SynChlorMet cassette radical SAM/SPASM protein ScmF [Desulfobaccales bacterium]